MGGTIPDEWAEDWTDLTLCREVYHCAPTVLDEQDYFRVLRHIVMLQAEREAQNG